MKKGILMLMAAALLALPVAGFSASHNMDHGSKASKGHSMAHEMDSSMIMLPEQTVDGVVALVHLKDVKETMAKMGMKHTHHFMVILKDAKSGKSIVPVLVAVKIVDPAAKESEPVELMAMEGHAGADVILATPGEYTFKVVAKLADDKKVKYEFKTVVK